MKQGNLRGVRTCVRRDSFFSAEQFAYANK